MWPKQLYHHERKHYRGTFSPEELEALLAEGWSEEPWPDIEYDAYSAVPKPAQEPPARSEDGPVAASMAEAEPPKRRKGK